jgi:quercetin dioxygenase-like cupin family protein
MGGRPNDAVGDIIVDRESGETITDAERRNVVLLTERDEISITWSRYGPGERGPDPHVHRDHVDAFYVLDGELTFALGPDGERVIVPAGGFAGVPPNLVHSFVNDGSADTRFLNFHTPNKGFAAYMRALGAGAEASFDSFDPPADGGLAASEAMVTGPGEGERLVSGRRVVHLKSARPELCFAEFEFDGPLDGPDVHHHDNQVDSFYVLEGELEMTVEDAVVPAGLGTLASVPRGVKHTFAHRQPGKSRVLNVHAPDGGFADFLRRVSD